MGRHPVPRSAAASKIDTLADVITVLTSDAALRGMNYRNLLRWCAGADGLLLRARLQRVAQVRDYSVGWVEHKQNKHWREEWDAAQRWRDEQRGGDQ